jgi:hypothetical protein
MLERSTMLVLVVNLTFWLSSGSDLVQIIHINSFIK